MVSDSVTLEDALQAEAIQNTERGVQFRASPPLRNLLDRVNWDDLHVLRNVADAVSLRRAALDLGLSVNTVRSRIARLETALNTTMFARDRHGFHITAEGRTVLSVANEIRSISAGLPAGQGNNILVRHGEIRICASEGVGTFWLTPRLPELKMSLPDIVVSLHSFVDQKQIKPGDYDIAIGFERPDDPEVIVAKLATLHFMPFASEQYIRQFGMPKNLDDMVGHQCIQQDAPGLNYDAMRFFFTTEVMKRLVSIKVSSSYSLYWAVASGVGIGALPTYAWAISKKVRPLDLPIQMKFDLWMSYSRSSRASAPVRAAIDWLRASFDAERYPWFGEKFVHPNAFDDPLGDVHVVTMFDHLVDDQI